MKKLSLSLITSFVSSFPFAHSYPFPLPPLSIPLVQGASYSRLSFSSFALCASFIAYCSLGGRRSWEVGYSALVL